MESTQPTPLGKPKTLPKSQAAAVMVFGFVLFAQAFFFSTEPGSSGHTAKILVALLGLILLCAGAYFRPYKPLSEGK